MEVGIFEFLRKHPAKPKMKVQVVIGRLHGERKQNPNENSILTEATHWLDVEWLPRMGEMINFTTINEYGNRVTQYGEVLSVIHNYDGRFVRLFVIKR